LGQLALVWDENNATVTDFIGQLLYFKRISGSGVNSSSLLKIMNKKRKGMVYDFNIHDSLRDLPKIK